MKEFTPGQETAAAEARLEWLLLKLHAESLRRGNKVAVPVLIGGTALRRAYGLTCPSTDLDFAVANEREMRGVLRACADIARKRWPQAQGALRTTLAPQSADQMKITTGAHRAPRAHTRRQR